MNDNWDCTDPEALRAYLKVCVLDLERKDKAKSPLASLTDRGIDLTPEEQSEVTAYADHMGVSLETITRYVEARYTIIGDRTNSKLWESHARAGVIPRNRLALTLKCLICHEADRLRHQADNA